MPSDKKQTPENSTENPLEQALAQLASLVKPSGGSLQVDINFLEFLPYLLLLWASFRVYQIEPYAEEREGEAAIVPLDNGRKIFDYGYYLSTSPGEDYNSYCTGKLIKAVQKMVGILANRGATLVGFAGHEIAQRVAWMECLERGIDVSNFSPAGSDFELYKRIHQLREDASKQIKASIEQRLT
jgi:hypothetical protein